jgi:hypothetical protein
MFEVAAADARSVRRTPPTSLYSANMSDDPCSAYAAAWAFLTMYTSAGPAVHSSRPIISV